MSAPAGRAPLSIVDAVGGLVILLLAGGLVAAAWWPVYETPWFALVAGVALLLGSLIALLGAAYRWPSWVVALAGLAAFLLAGVPLAVPAQALFGVLPTPGGLLELLSAVALGWKRLVTITLPVGEYQSLLVPPFALLLLAGLLGPTIAWRSRAGALAVLPAAAVFVAGVAFGSERVSLPLTLTLALLATCLVWVVWWRWRRSAGSARGMLSAVAILAVAAVGSVGAVAVAGPTVPRQVVRSAVAQPFDPHDYPSPLAGMRRYLRADESDAVQLRVTGLPEGARLRLAVLDDYDGVVYAVGGGESGVYVRIPSGVDRSGVVGDRADVTVQVEAYHGVWLPTAGLLETIAFRGPRAASLGDGFGFDLGADAAADAVALQQGDSYSFSAVLPPEPPEQGLSAATPGDARLPALREPPDGVTALLDEWTGAAQSPGARLLAMLDGIRATGYVSHGLDPDEPPSRSGHGADRITELVTAPRMIGDAEQYAVLGALMARQLGFPARVVYGFAPAAAEPDGTTLVRGRDVTAWIEVDTAEFGWVDLDVTPPERPIPDAEPEDPARIARPESIVPPPPDSRDTRDQQAAPDTSRDEPEVADPVLAAILAVLRVVGWALLGIAVLLSPFALVVLAKLRRRRLRRRAREPLQRIRGGWDEFADQALDRGLAPAPAATRVEFADQVGLIPARVLAAVADRAVFAPGEPDPRDADRVWEAVDELRAALDLGRSRWRRLRALVSLRSLGGVGVRRLLRRERRAA